MILAGYNDELEEFFKMIEENGPQTRRLISSVITVKSESALSNRPPWQIQRYNLTTL